jgi:predicted hydrolase (HD superfamily)
MTPETALGIEVERAFPSIECIADEDVRLETATAIRRHIPEYFFRAPAASSYAHHNPYCCGERGLWIHTLMVATAYERLVDSWTGQNLITEHEADLGRTAVLLHDCRKYGAVYDGEERAASDHDLQMASIVREDTSLDARVGDAVASHMGPWYDGPEPETPLDQLVHQADMMAATKNATVGVYEKPREITELYPSIPGADLQ